MDHPYYTVTVENLTRGWTYTATEGEEVDLEADVILEDTLKYSWGFTGDLIPGQMSTATANVRLAGKSAAVMPDCQVGDLVTIVVQVGAAGPVIVAPPPFRAAEPSVTLGRAPYVARMEIPLSDLSVDWRSRTVGEPFGQDESADGGDVRDARNYFRERGAEIAAKTDGGGISIGCPTWWANNEDVISPSTDLTGRYRWAMASFFWGAKMYDGTLEAILEKFINTHQPGGYTHTFVTVYDPSGHPTGYRRIGPDTWATSVNNVPPRGVITEPSTPVKIEAVPATRKQAGTVGLPLQLVQAGGLLTVEPREPGAGGYMTQLALDAAWCILPATARRARESTNNWLNIEGYGLIGNGEVDVDGGAKYDTAIYTRPYTVAADVAARGMLPRTLPTMINIGQSDDLDFISKGSFFGIWAAQAVADNFLSDETALDASWSYDAFTLHSSEIPQDVAEWLLPKLAPRLPGEDEGDGVIVRHVTLYNLKPDARFDGEPVRGFITSGSMEIVRGEIVWTLSTAPGGPQWTDAGPAALTVAEIVTAGTGLTIGDTDPAVTLADLAYVDH